MADFSRENYLLFLFHCISTIHDFDDHLCNFKSARESGASKQTKEICHCWHFPDCPMFCLLFPTFRRRRNDLPGLVLTDVVYELDLITDLRRVVCVDALQTRRLEPDQRFDQEQATSPHA